MGLYALKYPSRRLLGPLSKALAGVHPDVLSYSATAVTCGTALCYLLAGNAPGLLLMAVMLTLVRMGLNTLDGVVAIRRGDDQWLRGEIVNALPDRYSDVLYVAGIALSPYCDVRWGLAGLASMLLVSYAGMLGKAVGVAWQHHGPLGKVERLILATVFSALQFLAVTGGSAAWHIAGLSLTPMEACMALYVILGQVTIYNRVRGMVREIRKLEWPRRSAVGQAGRRVPLGPMARPPPA